MFRASCVGFQICNLRSGIQNFRFWCFGFRISCFGFGVSRLLFQVQVFGIGTCLRPTQVQVPNEQRPAVGFRASGVGVVVNGFIHGLWFMVSDFWFLVSCSWFSTQGLWFMVYGLWFMLSGFWFLLYGS